MASGAAVTCPCTDTCDEPSSSGPRLLSLVDLRSLIGLCRHDLIAELPFGEAVPRLQDRCRNADRLCCCHGLSLHAYAHITTGLYPVGLICCLFYTYAALHGQRRPHLGCWAVSENAAPPDKTPLQVHSSPEEVITADVRPLQVY